MRLIGIVLGEENSKVRNSETMALLDYGFLNTQFNLIKKSGEVVEKIKLDKSNKKTINVVLKDDLGIVEMADDSKHNYKYRIVLNDIKLPLKSGSVVGRIIVSEKNKDILEGDLVINEEVKRLNFLELFYNNFRSIADGNLW